MTLGMHASYITVLSAVEPANSTAAGSGFTHAISSCQVAIQTEERDLPASGSKMRRQFRGQSASSSVHIPCSRERRPVAAEHYRQVAAPRVGCYGAGLTRSWRARNPRGY